MPPPNGHPWAKKTTRQPLIAKRARPKHVSNEKHESVYAFNAKNHFRLQLAYRTIIPVQVSGRLNDVRFYFCHSIRSYRRRLADVDRRVTVLRVLARDLGSKYFKLRMNNNNNNNKNEST